MFQLGSYILRVAILNSELEKLNLAARFDKMLVEQEAEVMVCVL